MPNCRCGFRRLFALLLLAGSNPVLADDGFALSVPTPFALPANYQPMPSPELTTFPIDEFRPRGQSLLDDKTQSVTDDSTPMLRGSNVWQRWRDFRSHGRVRLLTLWETGGSTVSLQAGKKGEPSLQWTSRSMNRGGATRGVFDQIFSVSLASAGRNLHSLSRAVVPEVATNVTKLADANSKK